MHKFCKWHKCLTPCLHHFICDPATLGRCILGGVLQNKTEVQLYDSKLLCFLMAINWTLEVLSVLETSSSSSLFFFFFYSHQNITYRSFTGRLWVQAPVIPHNYTVILFALATLVILLHILLILIYIAQRDDSLNLTLFYTSYLHYFDCFTIPNVFCTIYTLWNLSWLRWYSSLWLWPQSSQLPFPSLGGSRCLSPIT